MPGTPEKKRKFSRRAWDGAIRQWKLRVHAESRKVMENSGKTAHHIENYSKTRNIKTDGREDEFANSNIDNKANGHESYYQGNVDLWKRERKSKLISTSQSLW